ncbi:hypothetical protein Acr_15g0006250 [Actinidia rufa]|uniref:Vacuolar iron transporter (VIT) family protein n=1 Tax=Actinidia rufa TaxID=165716 RepID=A0A7J0FTH3_9ERIC|nr:hypothetical protein Acr_15g0006250 [Actinidia rufa]
MEAMLPLKQYYCCQCAIEEDLDAKLKNVDIQKIPSNVIRNQDMETVKHEFSRRNRIQVRERVVENLDQHRVHCPNCNSCITKVVLRKPRTVESLGLFGCLSCFTIFIPQGNGFNLSRIFQRQRGGGNKGSSDQASVVATNPPSSFTDDKGIMGIDQRGPDGRKNVEKHEIAGMDTSYNLDKAMPQNDSPPSQEGLSLVVCKTEILTGVIIEHQGAGKKYSNFNGWSCTIGSCYNQHRRGPSESGTTQFTETLTDASKPIPLGETNGFKALEILKSIVYGGLMESITSLSVVSSAAASDATTVTIVAMGLANLIGGLFIIGPKIRELKNDHSEGYSYQRNGQVDRYQELRSDDKDLKLGVVAAASLTCIVVLAIGKAYIQKPPRFSLYIKTVLYYVSMAVMASGISYAVGDLVKRLMEKLGWFDSTAAVTLSFPRVRSVNPAWGSY